MGRGAVHDHHAVEALIDRLTRAGLGGVTEVRIQAGAAFSPEALQQAYQMLTPDTPLEGSRLVVADLAEERSCAACGRSWAVTREDVVGHVVVCPSCGALSPIEGSAGIEVVGVTSGH